MGLRGDVANQRRHFFHLTQGVFQLVERVAGGVHRGAGVGGGVLPPWSADDALPPPAPANRAASAQACASASARPTAARLSALMARSCAISSSRFAARTGQGVNVGQQGQVFLLGGVRRADFVEQHLQMPLHHRQCLQHAAHFVLTAHGISWLRVALGHADENGQ